MRSFSGLKVQMINERKYLLIAFLSFLLLVPGLGAANENNRPYVHALACDVVKNLEKDIQQEEVMVSVDIIKTKKEGKIIPLSRYLREELIKCLEGNAKLTVPPFLAYKTPFVLSGFIRIKGGKAKLYTKILDTESKKKLASYSVKRLEVQRKSLFRESFDDHLQKLVEDADFTGIDQFFYIERPVFKQNPETKLAGHIHQALVNMWEEYTEVHKEKKPFTHWTVTTEVVRVNDQYQITMQLLAGEDKQVHTTTAVNIPAHLAPFDLLNVTAKKFILIVKNGEGPYAKLAESHIPSLQSAIGDALSRQQIEWINNPSMNKKAAQWLTKRGEGGMVERADYVMEMDYSIQVSEPGEGGVVGGIEGKLELNVYETANGNLKKGLQLKNDGVFTEKNEISSKVGHITSRIKEKLDAKIKDSLRSL